jgi:hypothetical protein
MKNPLTHLLVQMTASLFLLSCGFSSIAATEAQNKTLFEHHQTTILDMQKRVNQIKTWWIKHAELDSAARNFAEKKISPLRGADDYFSDILQQAEFSYRGLGAGNVEERAFHKSMDALMDEAISKMYWSYIFHTQGRIKDLTNNYFVHRQQLLDQYEQSTNAIISQHGKLTERTNEKARRLLVDIANKEKKFRNKTKIKYSGTMEEAVLLRRQLALQILDWKNTLSALNRLNDAKFFNMRLYSLLGYNLDERPDSELESIFLPTLVGGHDVNWVKNNGSSLDRDLLTANEAIITLPEFSAEVPGPKYLKGYRKIELTPSETLRFDLPFKREPIGWLIKNQQVKQAM